MGFLIRTYLVAFLTAAGLLAAPLSAMAAGKPALDPAAVLERSEAAIGNRLSAHVLVDSEGNRLPLASYRGRPLVISLIYTACSSVCPVTTQHVLQAVGSARKVLGDDSFAVLTVGFDARNDTPARLAAYAGTQGIDLSDWRLATGDATTLEALLRELGFTYAAVSGTIQHPAMTSIIDADGRVYRQVYGDAFPDQVFVEPLKELVFGTTFRSTSVTDLLDRLRFICTTYNPSSGAYEFDYAIFFGMVIGGLSLLLTGYVVFRLWRSNVRIARERARESRG